MKALSSASVYLCANVLNAAIPFFLLPILTRVLTPDQYGAVAMFEASVACLGVFTGLSVHGAVGVRFYREDRRTFPYYVGVCLLILIGSTLLTMGIVALAAPVLTGITGLSASWLLWAVAVSCAQFLVNIRLAIWQSQDEALHYGAFQIVQTALNAALSLLLVVWLQWGSAGRMTGFAVAVLACGLYALLHMRLSGWVRWNWNRDYFKDAMSFGLPLIPHTLGALAVSFADRFIITENLGLTATGIYFTAVQLSMPLLMFGSSFNRAFVPWLFRKLAGNENIVAVTVSYAAILMLLLSGLLYALVVNFALPLILGEQYHQARPVALILIVGTSFQAAYYAVVNYIFYAKKTAYLAAITFGSAILYVAGAWFAVRFHSLQGLAVVFSAIQCLTFLVVWIVSSKVSPQPWLDFASMRKTFTTLFGSLTVGR